jgi:hypothetical protein
MRTLNLGGRLICAIVTIGLIAMVGSTVSAQVAGAIFTTDAGGSVNINFYEDKKDVWVNGGPRKEGAAGLPNGWYYIKVTDPSGATELGNSIHNPDPAMLAPMTMPNSKTPIYVANGEFDEPVQLWYVVRQLCGGGSNTKQGYKDTPNNGGEYKVWVSQDLNFTGSTNKTDNFKVRKGPPPPPQTSIEIYKFYDTDGDGQWNGAEPPIEGWKVTRTGGGLASADFFTDFEGKIEMFVVSNGATFTFTEVLPDSGATIQWQVTTGSLSVNLQVANGVNGAVSYEFGNRALEMQHRNGYGRTKGWWQINNPNGGAELIACDPDWRSEINDLCLRDNNGAHFDVTTTGTAQEARDELGTWIVGGPADNVAFRLSTQLATLVLNLHCSHLGDLDDAFDGVYVMWNNQLTSLGDLIDEANELLCNNPNPGNSGAAFDAMSALQTFIDGLNNNETFGGGAYQFSFYVLVPLAPIPYFVYPA